MEICFSKIINSENVKKAMQILKDNGVEREECGTVLQAIGYALCDVELQQLIDEVDESTLD